MKIKLFIVFGWVALLLAACHGVSESERMEEALAQGEVLYGEGDNDSLVFIPGLEQAALYFAERKQWSKAAHAALYNGRAQNAANNKTSAMQSFKAAEQYGRQAGDTLTVAWARYETGRLLFKEGRVEESLAVFGEAESTFGKSLEGRSLSAKRYTRATQPIITSTAGASTSTRATSSAGRTSPSSGLSTRTPTGWSPGGGPPCSR